MTITGDDFMFLNNENTYLIELVSDKQRAIVKRYMNYVYKTIGIYTTYSDLIGILNEANEKVNKFLKKDLTLAYI
jgi:hypothetical protein